MVGFISPPTTKDENGNATDNSSQDSKPKSSIDSNWCCNFDLGQWVPEIDDLSLPLADSFLDLDSIKDWIEEMQGPESGGLEPKVETYVTDEFCERRESGKEPEKIGSSRVGSGGDINGVVIKGYGCGVAGGNFVAGIFDEANMVPVKTEHPDWIVEHAEFDVSENCLTMPVPCPCDEALSSAGDEIGDGSMGIGGAEKLGSLSCCAVEERIGKVSLVDGVESTSFEGNCKKESKNENNGGESSPSDSAGESSLSSSSSSSCEEGANDGEEDGEGKGEKRDGSNEAAAKKMEPEIFKGREELEEGEIMETDADEMVGWSGDSDDDCESETGNANEDGIYEERFFVNDDDDDAEEVYAGKTKGPIRSKNELTVLPPVPPVDVILQPSHQISPIGFVSSILGAQVIVEGAEKHNPLSEGSILWFSQTRSPLGRVDEIFGPVKNPFYIVRYNSEKEVPTSISQGTLVSFVPEFVNHVLSDKNLYQKGYDASGENDEEVLDEVEFSDDEKEAEYRRMMKFSKRGISDQKPGANKRKNDKFRRNSKPPFKNTPNSGNSANSWQSDQQHFKPHMGLITWEAQCGSSGTGMIPILPSGHGAVQVFPQPLQQPLGKPPFKNTPNSGSAAKQCQSDQQHFEPPMGLITCETQPGSSGMTAILPSGHGLVHASAQPLQQSSGEPPFKDTPNSGNPAKLWQSDQQRFEPPTHETQPGSSEMSAILPPGHGAVQAFPRPFQQPLGFGQNGVCMNASPFQQCNTTAFSSGFQANIMPWMQQQQPPLEQKLQSFAMPMVNIPAQPFQQSIGPNQSVNMVLPFGPSNLNPNPILNPNPNLNPGPAFSYWPAGQSRPNILNQAQFSMGFCAQRAQRLPMMPGLLQSGLVGWQSGNMQPTSTSFTGSIKASPAPLFNQGVASSGQGMMPGLLQSRSVGWQSGSMRQTSTSFTSSIEILPAPLFNQAVTSSSQGGKRPLQHRGGGGRHFRGGRRGNHQSR